MLIQDAIEGFLLDLKAKHRSWNTLRHYEHKLRIWSNWMAEQFGVSHFWVYMDLGGLDHGELRRSMERFATRVIPQCRSITPA